MWILVLYIFGAMYGQYSEDGGLTAHQFPSVAACEAKSKEVWKEIEKELPPGSELKCEKAN